LTSTIKTETGIEESAVSSAPMAKALKNDYPEVENTVRLRMREEMITINRYFSQTFYLPTLLFLMFSVIILQEAMQLLH
jgi:hypothetical protein